MEGPLIHSEFQPFLSICAISSAYVTCEGTRYGSMSEAKEDGITSLGVEYNVSRYSEVWPAKSIFSVTSSHSVKTMHRHKCLY